MGVSLQLYMGACISCCLISLQQTCELVVYRMSRAGGNDASFEGFAYKGQVADEVEQFVTCRFVGPHQRFVVQVAHFGGIAMFHLHHVGQAVELGLRHLLLVDDDGVVEVASLDEASRKQRLNLANEYERAAGCDFRGEIGHVVQRGKLV